VAPIICAAAALGGCAAGPDYVRPTADTPSTYKEAQGWKQAEPQDEKPRGAWWEVFKDAKLDALLKQVEVTNQTLRAAEARVREANALTQAARAAYFPIVSANASATRSGGRGGALGSSGGSTAGPSGGPRNNYNVALDVNWEIDLWGRVRRTVEASEATAQASVSDLEAARLSAQAQLAEDYFLLRAQDADIRLLNDTVAAYERSLQLTRNQYAVGVVGRADVAQAETQFKSTQAQAIDAGVQRAQLEHAIAVLVGKPPAEFTIAAEAVPNEFPAIPVGLPSDLLERRPDIAAAERRAAAANAQIGVAESAFFPALTLSATGGFQSSLLSEIFSAPRVATRTDGTGDRDLRRERRQLQADGAHWISGGGGQSRSAADSRGRSGRPGRGRQDRARIARHRPESVSGGYRQLPGGRRHSGRHPQQRARGDCDPWPAPDRQRGADQGTGRRLE
jgi:NodT family efflux transporter outer membrane factor (OMF) lipoprotein